MRKKTCDQLTRAISIGTFQQRQVHPLGLLFMDTYLRGNSEDAGEGNGDGRLNDDYDAVRDDKMDAKNDSFIETDVHDSEVNTGSNLPFHSR